MIVDKEACQHDWAYPPGVIDGPKPSEVVIVRYCRECGLREMALVKQWEKAAGNYALDEHYE